MEAPRDWHRLFGMTWIDFFCGTDVEVQTEVDMSLKQQFLDLLIIRRGQAPLPFPVPDGFEALTSYNLVTFKSFQETLDSWSVCELVGHYVAYRKRVSPSLHELIPSQEFRLFAVCARFPVTLDREHPLVPIRPGVYELRLLGFAIRLMVIRQLPQTEENAMLHLFSAQLESLRYGQDHYHPRSPDHSTLLYQLLKLYREEQTMSEKLLEYVRQTMDQFLATLTIEERLKGIPPEDRLKDLPPEERLKALPPEERVKGISPEELIKALSPEAKEALKRQLNANGSSPKSE